MKSKVIKKTLRVLLYTAGGLLLLLLVLYYAFRSPAFQTWIANRAGWYFSEQWGATVRIGGVDIEFWKKVVLEDVYVEDQHADTLLYAEQLKLDIKKFNPDSSEVYLDNVSLHNSVVKLKQYKNDSVLNLQFIIDEFSSSDTTSVTDSAGFKFGIGSLTLDNIRFSYKDENDTSRLEGINFSDIETKKLNASFSDIFFPGDTILCTVNTLALEEKSGFLLKKLSARASISPVALKMDDLRIQSNKSSITTSLLFQYPSYSAFNNFIDSVKMKLKFTSSNIEMEDVAFFSPELYGLKKKVFLDGTVSGKVSDLKGRNILLSIGSETTFKGNIDMTGLPDIDQTFMSFDAKEFRTSKEGVEGIPLPPFHEKHNIELPDNVSLFGLIRFKGNFSGFYNDFVSYGKFTTSLGNIATDISLKEDTVTGKPAYHGKFSCTDFELGRFLESQKYLGRISLNATVDGKGFRKSDAIAKVEGQVSSLQMYGYEYRGIDLKGNLSRNVFDGVLAVNDDNLKMDFSGKVDFNSTPTRLNFSAGIKEAGLSALKLVVSDVPIGLRAGVDVDVTGNSIDDITGNIYLQNVAYFKGREKFSFNNVKLQLSESSGNRNMDVNSSLFDLNVSGKFTPTEVVAGMNKFFRTYFPVYLAEEQKAKNMPHRKEAPRQPQQFSYSLKLHNMDLVSAAFLPDVKISCPASLQGQYDDGQHSLSVVGEIPALSAMGYKFKKCRIAANSDGNKMSFLTTCQRLSLSDSAWIDNLNLSSEVARDTVNFRMNWKNSSAVAYDGDLPGYVSFSLKPQIHVKLLSSRITIADSTWLLNANNQIMIDSSFVRVRDLDFSCGKQRVKVEGNISQVREDQLYLMLTSFSLTNFNTYLKGSGIALGGVVSGNTSVANIYDSPLFGSSIDVKDFRINKELIGDGSLVSLYDSKKEMINFNGKFSRQEGEALRLSGNYFPLMKENNLDATAEVRDFRLEFFEPFIKGNLENIRGLVSADLKIEGSPDVPRINGVLKTKVDNIHVNYLGTNYRFNGDITVEPNSFDFANISLLDANGNTANIVNGKVFHDNFKNFQLDFDVNLNKFLCLNTTEKDNPLYYGKVFSTGILNVFGFLDNVNLSAAVKTDKAKNLLGKNEYSQLFIPLSGSEEVSENSFITFVKRDTVSKQPKYKIATSGFTMDFRLQPSEDAQVQLIFDEKVGDVIKASGTGDIRMVINEFGDFKMFGEYVVDEGDYLFTLKNVVNKKFRLEKGGSIHWSGSPEEADVSMSAIYELRTSLSPLFLPHEYTDAIRKRYPVDCVMKLTGRLLEPDIAFNIQMPMVDDFTRQQAYDRFNYSENEVNKQVFSLMFTNSFTPPQGQGQAESSGGGAGAVTTSTEMLSNQLSNWLSQISNEFDMGVHYHQGDSLNAAQVELALSTQLFNDKMTIDGSVANNSSTNSQNAASVVGDINVDYKLTEDGKFRAKAYNKANEGDVLNTSKGPYTQGVGVFYREEFETVGELYRRYLRKVKKKEPEKNP